MKFSLWAGKFLSICQRHLRKPPKSGIWKLVPCKYPKERSNQKFYPAMPPVIALRVQ